MSRIQIPLDVLTSRFNLSERFSGFNSGSLTGRFSNLRPLSEFFDFKRISKPQNFGEVQSRVNYNLSYFSSNYSVIFVMLCVYTLLTNWWLLFDIIFVTLGMFLIGKLDGRDLEIGTFKASPSQLYTGLLVIAIPVGLIASPFSTIAWLIGASGFFWGGGLDGRPRAPEFAPHGGRPSRRGRRRYGGAAGEGDDAWAGVGGASRNRVEELNSDVDDQGALVADVRGVGFSTSSRRFASDPLRFTGIDIGERGGNQSSLRRAANAQNSSEEDEDGESDEDSDDDRSSGSSRSRRREEALFESAMARIRQARAQGRVDVDLTRAELEAVNRMTERKRREAERRRRQEQEQQRVSIPISYLDPSSFEDLLEDESSSRQPSPPQVDDRQGYPPVGYFPAPKGRQRSSTTSSRTTAARGRIPYERDLSPDAYSAAAARPRTRREDTSPFRYSYVSQNHPPQAIRHSSDPSRARGSRVSSPRDPDEILPPPNTSAPSLHSSSHVDPFQYLSGTSAGPRAPPSGAAAAARRRISVSNPTPAAAGGRSRGGSRRVSPDATEESSGDDTASDDYSHGARVAPPTTRRAARDPPVIVEEPRVQTPEPRRSSRSKGAASKSPAKRKPAGGSSNATGGSSRSKKKR